MFASFVWHFGKFIQLLGLALGALSLIIGFQSHDAMRELQFLLGSVAVFLCGLLLVSYIDAQR